MKKLLSVILSVAILTSVLGNNVAALSVVNNSKKDFENKAFLADDFTGWQESEGIWYYFVDGIKIIGFADIGGARYYFNEYGEMVTGWLNEGNLWYYFDQSGAMVTGWAQLGGSWYYFDESGVMLTDWQLISDEWYYFNSSGAMLIGWQMISDEWYYFYSNGVRAANCWIGNYWIDDLGAMHKGWLDLDGEKYYFDEEGIMQKGWVLIDDQKYLFDNSGHCIEGAHTFVIDISKWQGNIDWEKFAQTDVDAVILRSSYGSGKDAKFDDYLENLKILEMPYGVYHYNTAKTVEDAKVQAQNVVDILKNANANPSLPVFVDIEESGGDIDLITIAKVYIEVFITNGYKPGIYANENYWKNYLDDESFNAYYRWIANYGSDNGYPSEVFSHKDEILNYAIWQYTSIGRLDGIDENTVDLNALFDWYQKSDGWTMISEKWYHYSDGYLTYGWFYDNNWYYLQSSGEMATDWILVDNIWYYLNKDGIMQTGWQLIENNWYYFNSSGEMVSGWKLIGGIWYYFNGSGAMVTGWAQIGGTWYYFNSSGAMLTDWQLIGGVWYYFNGSGAMTTGWQIIGGSWYYFYSDGSMAANCWVEGYYLTASGAML